MGVNTWLFPSLNIQGTGVMWSGIRRKNLSQNNILVIPTVPSTSLQLESTDAKDASSVLFATNLPVSPSMTRTTFWFEETITSSRVVPLGVYTKGSA
jgi:hypothetical protein